MKSYLSLAGKELKAQKITSALILIAVILSSIATTAFGQSIGILQSMRIQQASSLNGDRYATFHQVSPKQAEQILADSRLTDTGSFITLGHTKLASSELTLYLREYQGQALKSYPAICQLKEGRLPTAKGEVALSQDALQHLKFKGKPGDKITLPLSIGLKTDDRPPYEYKKTFILTGILQSSFLGYSTGTVDGIAGKGTARALLPDRYFLYSVDCKTKKADNFQSVIDDIATKLDIPSSDIQYNWVLLDAAGIDYDEKESSDVGSGFPFMTVACVLVGILVLLAAGLVIYNILKVAVTKRIRQYGTLRAMGSRKLQLYAIVTIQLLILCGIGLPAGIILGTLSARGILRGALGFLSPDIFMVQSSQELNTLISETGQTSVLPLLLSILITLLFAVLAAFPAAHYAARVSPTAALSGQASTIRRRGRKQKTIRSFESFYARLNLKRNKKRTAITILSIVMSITVFTALQSFTGLLDASRGVQEMHLGDYAITCQGSGISPNSVKQLRKHNSVKSLFTSRLTVYQANKKGCMPVKLNVSLCPGETFQLAAVDPAQLQSCAPNLTKEDLQDLKKGTACLLKNPIVIASGDKSVAHSEFQTGDTISVNGKKLRVAGLLEHAVTIGNEGFINGVQLLVSDTVYQQLTGSNRYSEVFAELRENADAATFEDWLDSWCSQNPGAHWLSYRQSDAQLAESFQQVRLLCWGLILFMGLIGVLNIINTVYTNIHTRIHEIGMQRAIGMGKSSLYKTFLWEGAYYGIIASALGAVCGYICTVFIKAATADSLQLTAFPLLPVLSAAAVSILACLTATAIPLRTIAKMSIVDSIESVE